MELGDLYQLVLLIILVAMLLGAGVLALSKFGATSGITSAANTSINSSITELSGISSNWLGLIITISVLSIIITLVVRSFAVQR